MACHIGSSLLIAVVVRQMVPDKYDGDGDDDAFCLLFHFTIFFFVVEDGVLHIGTTAN